MLPLRWHAWHRTAPAMTSSSPAPATCLSHCRALLCDAGSPLAVTTCSVAPTSRLRSVYALNQLHVQQGNSCHLTAKDACCTPADDLQRAHGRRHAARPHRTDAAFALLLLRLAAVARIACNCPHGRAEGFLESVELEGRLCCIRLHT